MCRANTKVVSFALYVLVASLAQRLFRLPHEDKLEVSDLTNRSYFGYGVSADQDSLVVSTAGGSAYVFGRSGSSWEQQFEVTVDGAVGGLAVSVDSGLLAVGCPQMLRPLLGGAGSVQIFYQNASRWYLRTMITGESIGSTSGSKFGITVAVNAMARTLVVGAPYDQVGSKLGAAYVFAWNGTAWRKAAQLSAFKESFSNFGCALSFVGDTLAVGAPQEGDGGAVYVFTMFSASRWKQEARLHAAQGNRGLWIQGGTQPLFGYSVSLGGDFLVVGAPEDDNEFTDSGAAYVFRREPALTLGALVIRNPYWEPQVRLTGTNASYTYRFGASVQILNDVLAVGAPGQTELATENVPAVYLFRWAGFDSRSAIQSGWQLQSKVQPSPVDAFSEFGFSIGIAGGDTLAVGAHAEDNSAGTDAGAVYLFAVTTPPPTSTSSLPWDPETKTNTWTTTDTSSTTTTTTTLVDITVFTVENDEFLGNVALVILVVVPLLVLAAIAVVLVVTRRSGKMEARQPDIVESVTDSERVDSVTNLPRLFPIEDVDVESMMAKADFPRRFPSGVSSLETMRRPFLIIDPCSRSAFHAAVQAELARWSARDQASIDIIWKVIDMMAKAEAGALITIAPLAELKRLHTQSTDNGYLTKRLKDISVFHPCFEQVFLEFTAHSETDCWAHDFPDPAARGLPKDGAILLSPAGSPAKCAVKVVGLPLAPSQWPGHGTRHETAVGLAGHLQQGVVLVLSSTRTLHCLLARDRGCLALQAEWLDSSNDGKELHLEEKSFSPFKPEPEPEFTDSV